MTALAPADIGKLVKICGLFSSDKDGERAAAAAAAHRLIQKSGLDWATVLQPPEPQPVRVEQRYDYSNQRHTNYHTNNYDLQLAHRHTDELSGWEHDFVVSVSRQRKLSPRQREVIAKIAQSLRRKGFE